MITIKELTDRTMGDGAYEKLQENGLVVTFKRSRVKGWYLRDEKPVIGRVKLSTDLLNYDLVDFDEYGYQIVFAESDERIFTKWESPKNIECFEVFK